MSTTTIIIGIGIGLLLAGAMIFWRRRPRDVFAVLLVIGIAALAVIVTITRVVDYREDQAAAIAEAAKQPLPAAAAPRTSAPETPRAWWPSPGGASGSAAPQAVESPYAGGSR